MKDKEARKQLEGLRGLAVRHCPKCKHDTVQRELWDKGADYQCLVCGSNIECRQETTYKVKKHEVSSWGGSFCIGTGETGSGGTSKK